MYGFFLAFSMFRLFFDWIKSSKHYNITVKSHTNPLRMHFTQQQNLLFNLRAILLNEWMRIEQMVKCAKNNTVGFVGEKVMISKLTQAQTVLSAGGERSAKKKPSA